MGGWQLLESKSINISPGCSMGATSTAALEARTAFGVVLPRCGIPQAAARWVGAGEIGGEFRRPLDLSLVEDLPEGLVEHCGFAQVRVRQGLL